MKWKTIQKEVWLQSDSIFLESLVEVAGGPGEI